MGIEALFADDDILVRLLRDDAHAVALMARWLSDERVLEFYEGRDQPFDEARFREKFGPRARAESRVVSCVIELDGAPIGDIQHSALNAEECREAGLDSDGPTYGVDMFIGEPELWGQGVGSRTLAAMARYLIKSRDAELVTIDPVVTNARAIRAYEKAGFERVRVLPERELHEGALRDSWLMVAKR